MQNIGIVRKMLQSIKVRVEFVIQTTFQSSALTAQLCLIDRQILVTRCGCCDTFKICKPCCAAKFTTATAYAAYFSGFLSYTNLPHFHFHFKFPGKYSNQFTKINSVFCCVKKCRFFSISLNLHFNQFHLQVQLPCDCPGSYQRFLLS